MSSGTRVADLSFDVTICEIMFWVRIDHPEGSLPTAALTAGPSSSSSSSSMSGALPMNPAIKERMAFFILLHSREVNRDTMQG